MRHPFPGWIFISLIILTAWPLTFSGCKKKDPSRLDTRQWVSRNLRCAQDTLADLERRVSDKMSEAERLMTELQTHLQKHQCPVGKHPECVPTAGTSAVATLLSGARVPGEGEPVTDDEPGVPQDPDVLEDEALALAKKVKAEPTPTDEDATRKPKPALLPGDAPASDTEPGPQEIARRAGCGMDVPEACSFLPQDTVVSRLTMFCEQAAQLEQEVVRFLQATGQEAPERSLQELFESMRTLEGQIHELVTREELAARRKGDDEAFYRSMHPQVIKGIISDLSLAVPKKIIADLRSMVPRVQKSAKFFDQHEAEWNQKLGAAIRHLHKSQRVHANHCLGRPNCWQFRQCVKRYNLPGILMLE
jgi:hypothetical protein